MNEFNETTYIELKVFFWYLFMIISICDYTLFQFSISPIILRGTGIFIGKIFNNFHVIYFSVLY